MKDIIAAQQIRRRSSSLLSSAAQFRVLADNSFINDQHPLPVRRKKRPRQSLGFFQQFRQSGEKPAPRKPPVRPSAPKAPAQQAPAPGTVERGNAGTGRSTAAGAARLSRKTLFGGAFLLVAVCLVYAAGMNYIPDPDPPEDTLFREGLAAGPFRTARTELSPEGDAIPLDLTETFAWQEYTVRSGDSVEAISRRFGLSLDAVIASNELRNVRRELRAGQKIRIPNMDGIPYTVKKGDSYTKIAADFEVPLEAVLDANDIQSGAINAGTVLFIPGARMDKNALRQALGELFIYPVSGRMSSPFGWRRDPFTGTRSYHAGLDLSAPMGTPVKAAADGRVSATGTNAVYGNFIILSHSGDYQTMYAHLSRILVKGGSYVNQGTEIGRVGSTGRSTGPHLHFSVYKNKRAINPLEVLNK
ncbi:MAG: peptidoglycan DD-metalloendopeptidase family protein [Treponema sp.]|jgi:murein DD-endopeptidase MepM/ murein hydrolase activator NlpD|nr:peptidoglycan DD-metalloendopeptidase family protein [Treponema sp.]